MVSRSAQAGEQARADRLARMTPGERVDLAFRLGEQGLAAYMTMHDIDRPTAISRIRATRRLGRPHSAAADPDVD